MASFPKASRHRRKIKHAPEVPKTLGDYLRLARIDRGLKQTELAAVLGVVYQTVVKWENNVTQIGPHSRARILAFLGDPPSSPDANPTGDCRNI
jgi:transcriptional regulator with XRE-family HTH domain